MDEIDAEIYGLHCDIGRLETENADLRSENDKLWQELTIRKASEQEKIIEYLRQENVDWEDKYRALAAENAKLQKLLHILAYCADDRANCDQCAMNGKPHAPVPQSFCDEMAELLRQHGVEVD